MFLTALLTSIIGTEERTQERETSHSDQTDLDSVSTKRTISDVIDYKTASDALPGRWKLQYDLIYGDSGSLTETAIIIHPSHHIQYRLEPVDTFAPLDETRVSIEHAHTKEEHLTTILTFEAGCKAVIKHITEHQQQRRKPVEAQRNGTSLVMSKRQAQARSR